VNAERILINPLGRTQSLVIIAVLLLFILNGGCSNEVSNVDYGGDPVAKIRAIESENTRLQSENQSKSEQLAVLNAKIPGGLSLGEREKRLDQREARLAQTEQGFVEREAELKVTEQATNEEVSQLGLARKEFVAEKEELLIQIGESKQITEHYDEIVQEKKDALTAERTASVRVGRFLTYVAVSGCVAFIAILLAITYAIRHRIECRHIEMAMDALIHANIPIESREQVAARLGRTLPNYPKDQLK
jgi:hypothetical protein